MESSVLEVLQRVINNSQDKDLQHIASMIARELKENDNGIKAEDRNLLRLLANAASMRLTPESNNEPFQASIVWSDGRRSALPSDFSSDDFNTLSEIADNIDYLPLKSRIFDLLWVSWQPNKHIYARRAIDCYISESIGSKKLSKIEIKELERAYRLSKQINYKEQLAAIEQYLYDALYSEPDNIMYLIADLIERTNALKSKVLDIALRLEDLGVEFIKSHNFNNAIRHFQLSSRYYKRGSNEEKHIFTLVQVADCYAKDADKHFNSGRGPKLMSSNLFESAIQAYRQIPAKFRERYSVDNKISELRHKLRESGRNIFDEMRIFSTPLEKSDELIAASKSFVANKKSEYEAIIYLSKVCSIPDYESLKKSESENMSKYFISSLFGPIQYSSDGRVIDKTPAVGFNNDQDSVDITLNNNMIRSFGTQIELSVRLSVVPALKQILSEHTISRSSIFGICNLSPIVPKSNIHLISHAIWLGFELEFSTAIHLIAPQVELIVRNKLKDSGVHTPQLDENGIEHERGLSTLLGLEECNEIFSKDEIFELKAVFSSSSGPNLRNEVAHGLMTDTSAYSFAPNYAWWVLIRMIIHSIIGSVEHSNK
ncbi:DUF4209 domain-containing protein [Psychrobacter sp. NG254]|uniref:DUF4209 domain-containing protein n=1 Tax=Psychrobacter sp. NG254 TaxID=2782003 RepID=UPI001888E3BA|nr:DUF4209 domain-containing protein [Psychrobacter sp. NG254]